MSLSVSIQPYSQGSWVTAAHGIRICPNGHPAAPPPWREKRDIGFTQLMSRIRNVFTKQLWGGKQDEYWKWWDEWAQAFPLTLAAIPPAALPTWTWPQSTLTTWQQRLPVPAADEDEFIPDPVTHSGSVSSLILS
jgi:hypothetical protein